MILSRLIEYADVAIGQGAPQNSDAFSNEGCPFIRAGSLDGLTSGESIESLEFISESSAKKYKLKLYPANSVVFAKSGMSATKNRVYKLSRPCYVVSHLAILLPKKNTNPNYLRLVIQREKPSTLIKDPAYPSIGQNDIENFLLPFPSYNDQIRIATILTRAENLIAKRKESIKALDELFKSTFLEMFGFSTGKYKKWKTEPLISSTEIVSGVTKGKKYLSNELIEVPYMRVANVQDGHLNLSEIKTIAVTEKEIKQYKLMKGDLLLTEGGDPDKLGRGAIWNGEISKCIHQNHIFRVRIWDKSINPIFLSALIASKYGKGYFLKAAKQTTGIASINSIQLKAFPLIKPPIELQNQFAAIVEKVESIKSKYTQSLAELENLYGSLSQRAFKGELDVSKIPADVHVV
jgi:type I restriction enzyme S subunit